MTWIQGHGHGGPKAAKVTDFKISLLLCLCMYDYVITYYMHAICV